MQEGDIWIWMEEGKGISYMKEDKRAGGRQMDNKNGNIFGLGKSNENKRILREMKNLEGGDWGEEHWRRGN
jgi:hypothetical protein